MKRKDFIKSSALLVAGGWLATASSCKPKPKSIRKNWAGNYTYQAPNLHQPTSAEEVQILVKELKEQKALGSRHSFNSIADSLKNQISTNQLRKIISMDENANTLTFESGLRYGDIAPKLDEKGYALHNLASLPHITVAGACSTGTHGSGVYLGNLATQVAALEMVTGMGDLVTLNKDKDEDFNGIVVGLGALGVVTKVTLAIEPRYEMTQDVYQNLPLESLKEHFDDIMSSGYSVSLFSDWQGQKISQVWIKRRLDEEITDFGNDFYGATRATKNLHPIVEISAENCTEQMGKEGPWYNRLPHFKMGFMPSGGEELQSEYFVPKENAVDAILALEKNRDLIFSQLMITEIRAIAGDNLWMSPCYHQDSVAIHFTWKQNWKEVSKLLPMIEAELSPFSVKPHWGKLFTIAPDVLHDRYQKLSDFNQIIEKYDPDKKFSNEFLAKNVYIS